MSEPGLALGGAPVVKICGVTSARDARLAAELGARMIGLNFYPPSPRSVEAAPAREIAAAARAGGGGRVVVVGVFVNRPREEVEEIDRRVGLDLLQFHGDESGEDLAPFGRRAIKVFRVAGEGAAELPLHLFPAAWGFLFDIHHGTLYGGTGSAWDYRSLAGLAGRSELAGRPYLVAGGIRPGNARRALAESGAAGVDVCSGVESAPGIKERGRLEQLMREVLDDGAGSP